MSIPFTHIQRALHSVQQAGRARFHMPGHMGKNLFQSSASSSTLYTDDVTELDEMDVISDPEGCLKRSQTDWSKALDTVASFYLTGGSTLGIQSSIQAAILASCSSNNKSDTNEHHMLVARNAHQSVIHGLVLTGATPHWLLPEFNTDFGTWGQVSPSSLKEALQTAEDCAQPISSVVITSPTYEGVVSDVASLSQICHEFGCTLIVDEAHGALFPYYQYIKAANNTHHLPLPSSAIEHGADVVVQSLHKTAGALTPAAIAHLPKQSSSIITPQHYQNALNLLQTTSPSWPLLANIEQCGAYLNSSNGQCKLSSLLAEVQTLRENLPASITAANTDSQEQDPLSLLLRFKTPLPPEDIAIYLETEHGIAFEAYTDKAVLYKIGLGATTEDLCRLKQALAHWHKHHIEQKETDEIEPLLKPRKQLASFHLPEMTLTPRQAFFAKQQVLPTEKAVGCMSAQTYMTCPPGIPFLFPGERISVEHLDLLPETVQVVSDTV